jgi:hypothetical protein
MVTAPGEIELYTYFRQHLGPRFEAAGLRLQFHYNQMPGIHFKVPALNEYRGQIVRGIKDGITSRFPNFPATGSIWITEITEHEVDSSERAFYRAARASIDQAYSLVCGASEKDPLNLAIQNLGYRRLFRNDQCSITIACLLRESDWRPLEAAWWHGKEVCIIGADIEGNFLLRHCDGTIRHWVHSLKSDTVIARSVREFVAGISFPDDFD